MSKKLLSSQDFRNSYEKFYNRIRNYLWPIDVLKMLADVEVDIYSAFIDYSELRKHLDRLASYIRDQLKEDDYLRKSYEELVDLLDDTDEVESTPYFNLYQVAETDPEINKVLKTSDEEEIEDENNEETAG